MASMNQLKQDFLSNLVGNNPQVQQQLQQQQQQQHQHQHQHQVSQNNDVGSKGIDDKNLMIRQTILHGKKGYDLRLFLDPSVASKFLCCICKKVCRDPQELSCSNAHIFCKQCIDQHFQVAQISSKPPMCPIDHEIQDSSNPTQQITFRTSRFVNNHIKELQVKCIQSHDNIACNWTGRLGDLANHMSRDCMFNIIQCPFALLGCPQSRLYKYQLKKHISNVADCNKHISLALQKIKNLKVENSDKSDMNNKMMGQLRAIKAISKNKETKINVLSKELDTLKENHKQLLVEYSKMNDDLETANHRINQYEKGVALLKQANEKLVKEIEILKMQQNHQSYASMPDLSSYNANNNNNINNNNNNNGMYGGGGGLGGGGLPGLAGGSNDIGGLGSLRRVQSNSSQSPIPVIPGANGINGNIGVGVGVGGNKNSLEYLVSNMSLESEKKIDNISNNNNNNNDNNNNGLSSKRVLFEFVKMHKDLPKEFNDMAKSALLQPNDDEASRFVRILLNNDKHPQFKKDIATIVSKLQSKK